MRSHRRSGLLKKIGSRARASAAIAASLLVIASGFAAPGPAAPEPSVSSRIVEATVYPDRAEVVREARVDLPAGDSIVEFGGLPWGVEPDSLRVSAKGVAATLGAVELREQAEEPQETADLIAARDEVRRLEREMETLMSAGGTAKAMRDFLASLRASTAGRESEKMGEGKADPNSIQAVYGFVRVQMSVLDGEEIARADTISKIDDQLKVARARLAAARPPGAIRMKTATVEIETKQAGTLTLRLAYLAPGASWRPAYRASLDAATGEVSLASEAVVRQSTGEDWSGVTLRLSTAAPARGAQPPEMSSLLLRPVEVARQQFGRVGGVIGGIAAPAAPEADTMRMESKVAAAEAPPEPVEEEAEAQEAGVVHSAYNVAFEVTGRSDVPADGREHRVGLRQETLKGKVEYRAVPALNAAAFMIAKTQSPAGYPLLAGPVRVFAGGAYLGASPLDETAPGADLSLPFGIDNRIAVERTPLPQARGESGIFGKEKRIAYAFRTTIENLRDQKATVVVEDRIPVSEDERIVVEPGKMTTPGSTEVKDRPGVLEWTLDLAPKEKREIVLDYTVRYPRDLYVPGAE